jgi:hypothetical protein
MKENQPSSWLLDPDEIKALGLIDSAQSEKGCNEQMRLKVLDSLPKSNTLRRILFNTNNNGPRHKGGR